MVIGLFVSLVLFSNIYRTWSDEIYQPSSLLAVHLGDTATLECFFSKDERYISWFKQTAAQKPHIIAFTEKYLEPVFYNEFNNSKRFKIQRRDGSNHLIISKTEPSDSAVYYCGRMKDFIMLFGAGTFLSIKGSENQKSNSKTVVQQPVSDPVHPGDSVTLQCTVEGETCAGEHSVYWFRHGSGESLPGLIYTHGNRSDECEKSPEAGSPTHSCVYSLPKRNLSPSDAGTYYCAVVTCGDILFGNGTKLEMEGTAMDKVILGLGSALVLCLILIIVLVCYIYQNTGGKPTHDSWPVQHDDSTKGRCSDRHHDPEMLSYAALHFADPTAKRGRKKRELKEESVYSEVKYSNVQ